MINTEKDKTIAPKGATINFEECSGMFGEIPRRLAIVKDFMTDNHWNNGAYWIGWKPVQDAEGRISNTAAKNFQHLAGAFTFKNKIANNVSSIVGTIMGNEPMFNILSVNDSENNSVENPKFTQIDDAIVNYWTNKGIHEKLKTLVSNKSAYGKIGFLIWIPVGYLVKDGDKVSLGNQSQTFAQILDKLQIEVLDYETFIDAVDPNFGTQYAVVRFEKQNNKDRYGVFYLDEEGNSCIRILQEGETNEGTMKCNLGGNSFCLVFGKYSESAITDSVISLQKSLNHALTNAELAQDNINFPETTFLNAEPLQEKDANGNLTGKIATPKQGSGVIRWLRGITTESINGEQLATPAVHTQPQADPQKFDFIASSRERSIDGLMGMGYKNLADSEYASGDARGKAMDDYDILTTTFETQFNTIGTKMIETLVKTVFFLRNQTNEINSFKVLFRCNISHGKLTNEDKTGMRDEVEKGLRSKENYMLRAKVTDNPNLEKSRIAKDTPIEPKPAPKPLPQNTK